MVRARQLWAQAFSALQERDFGWYWGGQVATATGFQLADIARGWLVYSLTGSALALSWLRTGWSIASLIAPLVGGLVADRASKRTVLLVGTGIVSILPLVIAWLITIGAIQWWYLPISLLLESLAFCFIVPARQAFLSTLMSPKALLNAMSLNFFAMAIPGVVFAIVGGILIDGIGAGLVFFLAAVAYGLGVLLFAQLSLAGRPGRARSALRRELLVGFGYVARQPAIMAVLGLGACRNILLGASLAFLPVFAADVFGAGALGLGLLTASVALGHLVGSLGVALLGDRQRKGRIMLGMGLASALFAVLFAQSPSFPMALFFLWLAGMASMAYTVIESTILQVVTTEEMRGRVAGFLRMTAGLTPLALLPGGLLADLWGAPAAVTLTGLIAVLLFAVSLFLWPSAWA